MEFISPKYLTEAFEILDEKGGELKICAGLTHILRFYSDFPEELSNFYKGVLHIGDMTPLAECREESGRYSIGAVTKIAALEADAYLARYAPSVLDAAHSTSTPQIRNHRTVGGEIAWGSYHSPLITTFMALKAKVRIRLRSSRGQAGREENIELVDLYDGEIERSSTGGGQHTSRNARTKSQDLILKFILPSEVLHMPGAFSFFRALTPKISTENSGVVLAVSGVAQNGVIHSASMVASGLWIGTLEAKLPLEGVKMSDAHIFERLYAFCDRYSFDRYRREGPSASQLGLVVFGLLKEGFSGLLGR